uniref:Uncharacterized protein n=1 Tax=Paramoeba aestuarina TaxID=180227 RepID=A0A7S4KVJ4_9EUKA|mmetsp:Transcript_26410/g.41100  ORF Transcript_26410/g.41100 Transcript_26410/m.41100 type:complete len:114 (+) Transcript_26410:419-760(+)
MGWSYYIRDDFQGAIHEVQTNLILVGHLQESEDYITLDGCGRYLAIRDMCRDLNRPIDSVSVQVESYVLEERDWHAMNRVADMYFVGNTLKPVEEGPSTYHYGYGAVASLIPH